MQRPLIHDPIVLAVKSIPANGDDLPIAGDLLDTLIAHSDSCVAWRRI